jgi:hypothetical protein
MWRRASWYRDSRSLFSTNWPEHSLYTLIFFCIDWGRVPVGGEGEGEGYKAAIAWGIDPDSQL